MKLTSDFKTNLETIRKELNVGKTFDILKELLMFITQNFIATIWMAL